MYAGREDRAPSLYTQESTWYLLVYRGTSSYTLCTLRVIQAQYCCVCDITSPRIACGGHSIFRVHSASCIIFFYSAFGFITPYPYQLWPKFSLVTMGAFCSIKIFGVRCNKLICASGVSFELSTWNLWPPAGGSVCVFIWPGIAKTMVAESVVYWLRFLPFFSSALWVEHSLRSLKFVEVCFTQAKLFLLDILFRRLPQ